MHELSDIASRLIATAVLFLLAAGFTTLYDMQVREDDEPATTVTRRRRVIAATAAIGFSCLLTAMWV